MLIPFVSFILTIFMLHHYPTFDVLNNAFYGDKKNKYFNTMASSAFGRQVQWRMEFFNENFIIIKIKGKIAELSFP